MTLNIDSIQNAALKRAAEVADSKGENAFNSNLDQNELSLFIKAAYQNKASTEEIMEVVNQVGVSENEDDETQKTIATLQRLEVLEKKLEGRKQTYKGVATTKDKIIKAGIFSVIGGVTAGITTFKNLSRTLYSETALIRRALPQNVCYGRAAIVGVITGVLGALVSKAIGTPAQSIYKEQAIAPLKDEIKTLKSELQVP